MFNKNVTIENLENPNGYGWATSKNYGHDIVSMVNVLLKK